MRFTERRDEERADGSLRVVYAASIRDCRPCPLREQCQWEGHETRKLRQVSVVLHLLPVVPAPLLWRDWSRRVHRRACMHLVRDQRIEISLSPSAASPPTTEVILSREQRALASLVGRAARSERASPHRGPGDDQTVRHPSRLCHFARVGDSVTRPH